MMLIKIEVTGGSTAARITEAASNRPDVPSTYLGNPVPLFDA